MKPDCAYCNRDLSEAPSIWVEDAYYCYHHTKKKIAEIIETREYELIREHEVFPILRAIAMRDIEAREADIKRVSKLYAKQSLRGFKEYLFQRDKVEKAIQQVIPPVIYPRTPPDDIDLDIHIEMSEYASEPTTSIGYDRNAILQRDGFTCQVCLNKFPKSELEVHHVIPQASGGSDSPRNLITLCIKCHKEEDLFNHVHKHSLRAFFPKGDVISKVGERFRRMERIKRRIKNNEPNK